MKRGKIMRTRARISELRVIVSNERTSLMYGCPHEDGTLCFDRMGSLYSVLPCMGAAFTLDGDSSLSFPTLFVNKEGSTHHRTIISCQLTSTYVRNTSSLHHPHSSIDQPEAHEQLTDLGPPLSLLL